MQRAEIKGSVDAQRNSLIWKIPRQGEACQAFHAGAWGLLGVRWELSGLEGGTGPIPLSSKLLLSISYVPGTLRDPEDTANREINESEKSSLL